MNTCCPKPIPCCGNNQGYEGRAFAFILVLFILLVICGAAYIR